MEYPITIKQHLEFVVFQVPDLGVTVVEQSPTQGRLSPKYLNKMAQALAKTWLKSSERLQQYHLAGRKPPRPSRQKRPIEEKKERLYTTPEVAQHLGVSENTVRRLVRKGELKCTHTPGKHRRFTELHIQSYKNKKKKSANDEER